jgi:hypothetical protein
MRPSPNRSARRVVATAGNPWRCMYANVADAISESPPTSRQLTLNSSDRSPISRWRQSLRGAAQGQPIPGFDKSQCGYTFGGVGRAAPADAEILVAAGDSIFENSPVDLDVAASVTQAQPSGSIGEVALKTAAITAKRRLFNPDEADDASIVEFGVSLAEQILEILNAGVAEKVDAVEQVDRMPEWKYALWGMAHELALSTERLAGEWAERKGWRLNALAARVIHDGDQRIAGKVGKDLSRVANQQSVHRGSDGCSTLGAETFGRAPCHVRLLAITSLRK